MYVCVCVVSDVPPKPDSRSSSVGVLKKKKQAKPESKLVEKLSDRIATAETNCGGMVFVFFL